MDIALICSKWELNIKEKKKLSEKATLLISTKEEKFVLKKKKGDIQATENEIKLLDYLMTNGLKIQIPLVNSDGETIVTGNNKNYCLYNFIERTTFNAIESLNHSIVSTLFGETIASLHILMEGYNHSSSFVQKDLFQMVSSFAINEIQKVDHDEKWTDILKDFKGNLKNRIEFLPKQLIHRDAHIFNMIYKDNRLSGVIDFENVEVNVRIFDICYCATSVLNEVFSNVSQREKWFHFVECLFGKYNELNPLTKHELNSIWHVMLCIQLIFMAYFSKNNSLYEINKSMFMWIYENKENIKIKSNLKNH